MRKGIHREDQGNLIDNIDLLNLPAQITSLTTLRPRRLQLKRTTLTRTLPSEQSISQSKTIAKDPRFRFNPSGDHLSFGRKGKSSHQCKLHHHLHHSPTGTKSSEKGSDNSVVYLFNNRKRFQQQDTNFLQSHAGFDDFLIPRFCKSKEEDFWNPKKAQITESSNVFPFKGTPSGNLKVNANQVVFESKKFSVLVAEPERTQVKVSDRRNPFRQLHWGQEPFSIDVHEEDGKMMQKDEYAKNSAINAMMKGGLGSLLAGRITDAPVRKEKEASEYEGKATCEILDPELNLTRLGYCSNDSIDWNEVALPEKKNLYLELYARITNFTNADCKVYIDNEEFNCHLLVLQCYSEVFHTYVAVKKVELPSDRCSPASFAFIYEWMITGDPSYRELNRDNVLDIFNAAKYLRIQDLIEQCWAFIDNTDVFNEDTAFLLYIDAKEKGLIEVRELMLPRIQKFFLMLVSSQDWLELELEDVQCFLQSNYICVNCEMEVFMSAVRWLKHDWENRDKYKTPVLSCVRFGNIAPWQLVDIKRNPDNPEFRDLAKDPEICKMIDDGLAYSTILVPALTFVIIKYWYGQENEDYQHWNSILALKEPPLRNWSGTEKTYFTYREFLIYLDQYRRNQMLERSKPRDGARFTSAVNTAAAGNNGGRLLTPRDSHERMMMHNISQNGNNPRMPTTDEFLSVNKNSNNFNNNNNNGVVSSGSKMRNARNFLGDSVNDNQDNDPDLLMNELPLSDSLHS